MAGKDKAHMVAAIIGATLAAHGKTKQKNIEKAVRAYRACLDELNKPPPAPEPDPEQERRDQAIIDQVNQEAKRTIV
jgi:phage-related protein